MSRNRRDGVQNTIYDPFLNNPSRNRTSLNERMYVRILTELSVNRFKWIGLPEEIDERFVEMTLFFRALCVFFWDEEFSRYFALRSSGAGKINMYDNPTTFTVTGNTMINRRLKAYGNKDHESECVPIWANAMRVPDLDIVQLYATRLAKIDRTIDINVLSQRHTNVILSPESQRQTYVNLFRQYEEGQPVILGNESLDMDAIKVFNVGVHHEVIPSLQIARAHLWNECMTLLGINNSNQEKRERLVADEVSANDDQVMNMRNVALKARRMAAERINARYGLSVEVAWNADVDDVKLSLPSMGTEEGVL